MDRKLVTLSATAATILSKRALTIAVAESCTGGLLSHVLTAVSGSSSFFIGGVVAYSNDIKESILGVQRNTLMGYGAVSEQTACEMAAGVRNKFSTAISLSTTGIAGPTGGTPTKPVGLVWIGISNAESTKAYAYQFNGDREAIKTHSVEKALLMLIDCFH